MEQISCYINEISDEFKQDILKSIRSLMSKGCQVEKQIVSFLLKCLDQEGSIEFKKSVIRLVSECVEQNRELGLMGLMEFIEDCEHNELHIMILDLVE